MNTSYKAIFCFLFVTGWMIPSVGAIAAEGTITFGTGGLAPAQEELDQEGPRTDLASVPGDATAHHIITEAGSYYLSQDLEVRKATGINIQSPGVTLDLNGFQVRRVAGSEGHGILIATTADQCTVGNGSVTGFAYGVRALSKEGSFVRLSASHCAFAGLVGGESWLIDDCRAYQNRETDIATGDGSTLIARPGSRERDERRVPASYGAPDR